MREAFHCHPGTKRWLMAMFFAINAVVAWNALRHDPRIAYDARQHGRYVEVLSEGRLPGRAETAAFYAPPLPYVIPALLRRAAGLRTVDALRGGLLMQAAASIALTFVLLCVCERIRPGDGAFKLSVLALACIPAVYFRTFAMLRGESYLATFGVVLVLLTLVVSADRRIRPWSLLAFAATCGTIALTRQLGFLLIVGSCGFLAVMALVRPEQRWVVLWAVLLAALFSVLWSGWFYLGLRSRAGSAMAWNVPRRSFSLANQPLEFYFGTGDGSLFSAPGRPRFQKQFGPVLYSDWWGDYWHYFLFHGRLRNGICGFWPAASAGDGTGTAELGFVGNYSSMLAYLGIVNEMAIVPTALMVGGMVIGGMAAWNLVVRRRDDARTRGVALVWMVAITTLGGYLWFVISYPRENDGDTVKATYVFQLAPLVAILGGEALIRIRDRSAVVFRAIAVLLVVVGVGVAPTWFSRWSPPLDCLIAGWDMPRARRKPAARSSAADPAPGALGRGRT